MKLPILWTVSIVLTFSFSSYSQPNTDIYLFDLNMADNIWSIDAPINISDNDGYDNQPSFWRDGESILYARTVNNQTEIARYFIESGNTAVLTNTLEGSEYSPTPTPDQRISSIRLDTTGLQLLYVYDFRGRNEVLVNDLVIGYHAWISVTQIVAFVLGEPSTMQIINTVTGNAEIVGENIGRSLHQIPNSKHFSYVDKSKEKWTINRMNPETRESFVLTPSIEGSEDYSWTPNNQIVMGKGSKLFLWEIDKGWKEIADVSKFGIDQITRLSVSPDGDKLVLVAESIQ
jgi:hypothetical protein